MVRREPRQFAIVCGLLSPRHNPAVMGAAGIFARGGFLLLTPLASTFLDVGLCELAASA